MTACGPACWEARDDICRCSCGGANHGCHRGAAHSLTAGLKRQKVYEGFIWELAGVSEPLDMGSGFFAPSHFDEQAQALNEAAGVSFLYAHTARKHYGEFPVAIVRPATDGEIARWPELAKWRGLNFALYGKPELFWTRRDDLTRQVCERIRAQQTQAAA